MFKNLYRCYPVSETGQHDHLEHGDKILMPASALDQLSSMTVDYPLLFKLTNFNSGEISHCGVMEFTSDEGTVLLPGWVMRNANLLEGDLVEVTNVSLKKAKFIKLRPHKTAFVELSDPKSVLESCLRRFSCLTVGDTIEIDYLGNKFSIDILETKPDNEAVSVIETDCQVDFDPPLDYKEPEKRVPVRSQVEQKYLEEVAEKFKAFMGIGRRLDGGLVLPNLPRSSSDDVLQNVNGDVSTSSSSCECNDNNKQHKVSEDESFKPFTGKSYNFM